MTKMDFADRKREPSGMLKYRRKCHRLIAEIAHHHSASVQTPQVYVIEIDMDVHPHWSRVK